MSYRKYRSRSTARRLMKTLSNMTVQQLTIWIVIGLAWAGLLSLMLEHEQGKLRNIQKTGSIVAPTLTATDELS
ncbi:MAG: hypothetical protein AAFX01_05760 [Cyanobacteria bacterium J06638_28]